MVRTKLRLFDPAELGPRADATRLRRRHLQLADDPSEQVRLNRDGAGLVPGTTDGLPVRLVKPHSAQKARMVSADLGTVGRAMGNKWFELHYLELFCGPGYLLDEATGEEVPGSPLQALGIQRPFDRYVFSDFSDICADALERRIAALRTQGIRLPPTEVLPGDANDLAHLERLCSFIDPTALVIAYLDPAKAGPALGDGRVPREPLPVHRLPHQPAVLRHPPLADRRRRRATPAHAQLPESG